MLIFINMLFKTRNEVLAVLAFFAITMLFKIVGVTAQLKQVIIVIPILLAAFISKVRSNRINIPKNGKGIKKKQNKNNFLNDEFIDNKALSYGATVLWLSTLFVIVSDIIMG